MPLSDGDRASQPLIDTAPWPRQADSVRRIDERALLTRALDVVLVNPADPAVEKDCFHPRIIAAALCWRLSLRRQPASPSMLLSAVACLQLPPRQSAWCFRRCPTDQFRARSNQQSFVRWRQAGQASLNIGRRRALCLSALSRLWSDIFFPYPPRFPSVGA